MSVQGKSLEWASMSVQSTSMSLSHILAKDMIVVLWGHSCHVICSRLHKLFLWVFRVLFQVLVRNLKHLRNLLLKCGDIEANPGPRNAYDRDLDLTNQHHKKVLF